MLLCLPLACWNLWATNLDSLLTVQAVQTMQRLYPQMQLQDVYKSFFQDYFGQGHLLTDTARAKAYLEQELQTSTLGGPDWEPTGARGEYVRVNLRLVQNGALPLPVFLDAFLQTKSEVKPTLSEWVAIWEQLDGFIQGAGLHFKHQAQDRAWLGQRLQAGQIMCHHSERFNRHYHFHYRIVPRTVFEAHLLPYLKQGVQN